VTEHAPETGRRSAGTAALGLSAMSYNVHRCIGNDGRADAPRVARIINELAVDIAGLQEVDSRPGEHHHSAQMDFLAEATGLEAIAGPTIQDGDFFYGNVLLTRHPVLAVRRVSLSVPGREPRGLLDVDIDVGGHTVQILVTHFGLRHYERRYQAEKLVESLAAHHAALTLVLGDINEWWPYGAALRRLRKVLGSAPVFRTFPSWWPLLPLDRIWARPASALQDLRVHATALTRCASDHLPLVAEVRLPPPVWPAPTPPQTPRPLAEPSGSPAGQDDGSPGASRGRSRVLSPGEEGSPRAHERTFPCSARGCVRDAGGEVLRAGLIYNSPRALASSYNPLHSIGPPAMPLRFPAP
jgi:endonuclease/exonuclease/phosphatase family metal-dependent hydrolase